MLHATKPNEVFEITGNELRPIVTDNSRPGLGKLLTRSLEHNFDIARCHGRPDFPVDNEPTVAIENRTQIIEGGADVEVGDVNVPMLVRPTRLLEALSLTRGLPRARAHQSSGQQNPIDTAGARRHNLLI